MAGDLEQAVTFYEMALAESTAVRPEIPGFLCGRLATLYRRLARYDDEVALLERYRDTQTADDSRTRFDARLSKARSMASRVSRRDSGALASVRAVKRPKEPRPRRSVRADAVLCR